MADIQLGMYRHYKGGLYQVVAVGKNEGTAQDEVIYRAMHRSEFGERTWWTRAATEFGSTVEHNGETVPRYKYLGPSPRHRLIGKLMAVAYFDLLLIFTSAILLLGIFVVTRDFRDPGFFFAIHPILGWCVVTILGLAIFTIGYMRFVGPWWLHTTKQIVPMQNITEPIRVAVIADLQVGEHKRTAWMEKVVERIKKLKPDLVVIAGDLVSNELNPEDETMYLEPLEDLKAICPVYAVLGNHDYGIGLLSGGVAIRTQDKAWEVKDRFKAMGIPLLVNELATVTVRGQQMAIYGIDDEWGGKPNYTALSQWDQSMPILLLAHNPDAILAWPKNLPGPNLTVAGHTHGGQLQLPVVGPIGDAYLKLPKTFYQGLRYYNKKAVFVTTGVGESLGPLRIGAPAEVAILTLQKP
jgi:predicted MPP superfamily phosphohydrolase